MVILYDYQVEHVHRIQEVLKTNHFCLDFSILGSGKTYTGLTIAKDYDFVLVISPKSVNNKWKKVSEEFGIPEANIDIITFGGLRKKANNKYLVTSDDSKEIRKSKYLKDLERAKRVIVIIDEIQNLKNNTQQFRCARELLKGKKTKFLGLSGSPIDKKEQASRVFALCDMYRSQLAKYEPGTGTFDFSGLEEIRSFLKDNTIFSRINYKTYCYTTFQGIFKKFVFEMECPKFPTTVDVKNGLYNFGSDTEPCNLWVNQLNKLEVYRRRNGNSIDIMSRISVVLKNLEKTKVKTAVRLVKEQLLKDPNKKVVLLFSYIDSITSSSLELEHFNPLVIYGKTPQKKRIEYLKKFQSGNTENRLLIGNLEILSTGIDLDDKFGNFPRICFCNANFNAITLYQLVHRFKRIDTKSNADIRFVYCKSSELEVRIMNALTRKTLVMKETTEMQVKHGVVFPGELLFEHEQIVFEHEKQDTCGICLTLFENDSFSLECKHIFHKECISEWFEECENTKCPYCGSVSTTF